MPDEQQDSLTPGPAPTEAVSAGEETPEPGGREAAAPADEPQAAPAGTAQSRAGGPAVFQRVPPRAPQGGRSWLPWLGGGCLGCGAALLLAFLGMALLAPFVGGTRPSLPGGDKIGLITIEGLILSGSGGGGLFGGFAGSDTIVRQLVQARRDPSIKAVVLRVNSPGGSAAASQEIYGEVLKLRRTRKPVIVSMGDVAASGGYYVAAAADKIVANGSTMTGSIGVIMEFMNLQGLYGKVGIDHTTIKSGEYKDIGSSSRQLTATERRLLQAMVDDVYDQFVTDVAEGRRQVSRAEVRRIADGRIFTGRQALKLKLVDELGNLQDAIALAARSAGITGRPTVVELGRRSFLDLLAGGGPSYEGSLRLPNSAAADERLVRALRQLLLESVVPR